jgi:nucleoside-diphosphate-sugar epimerase
MRCVVTGAAGFIGSHLCDWLLEAGHEVVGVDAFIPFYAPAFKEANLAPASASQAFAFHQLDLRHDPLEAALENVDVVFHLAAMAGLPKSWTDFDLYESCNVHATQRLLEALRRLPGLRRFVYASTSSVYGRFATGDETLPTRPISPYGVTKLAAEHLCRAYADEFGLPLVVLRYFSVYGPRQRPDMGYHRFIRALLADEEVPIFGDGEQVRGNTYVADCVEATVAAIGSAVGEVYNVGGGEAVSVWQVLRKLEAITGRTARVNRNPARPGDQRCTWADTTKLQRHFGWSPRIRLDEGLARQVAWQQASPRKRAPQCDAAHGLLTFASE